MKYILPLVLLTSTIYADGTCKKCEVLRKYHDENPNPYEYYDDYLKAVEEKKVVPKKVRPEDLLKEQDEQKSDDAQATDDAKE